MDCGSAQQSTTILRRSSSLNASTETDTEKDYTSETFPMTVSPDDIHSGNDENSGRRSHNTTKRVVVALIFLGFVGFVIADSLTNNHVKDGIESFLKWVEENPTAGVFAFVGVYFVATVLFVPGSLLTLGSGFVFANAFGLGRGVLLATLAVFVGASSGAVASFLLGRYLLRNWVETTLSRRYQVWGAVDAALAKRGLRIMALLRLSPLIPFNALNYVAGVTAVPSAHYVYALVAVLPGTLLYVFLGASAGSLADSGAGASGHRTVTNATIVVGVVFGVAAIAVMSHYAKKELNAAIAAEQQQPNEEQCVNMPV